MWVTIDGGGRLHALGGRFIRQAATLRRFGVAVPTTLVREIQDIVTPVLLEETPVSPDDVPGKPHLLSATERPRVKLSMGGGLSIVWGTDAPYAPFVLHDTAPHTIMPRNGNVLAFRAGGGMIFARYVNHPGTKANRYPERAVARTRPEIRAALVRSGQQILVGFTYG